MQLKPACTTPLRPVSHGLLAGEFSLTFPRPITGGLHLVSRVSVDACG